MASPLDERQLAGWVNRVVESSSKALHPADIAQAIRHFGGIHCDQAVVEDLVQDLLAQPRPPIKLQGKKRHRIQRVDKAAKLSLDLDEVGRWGEDDWTHEELLTTCELFKELDGNGITETNQAIVELAQALGRRVRQVEAQALMFRPMLDPEGNRWSTAWVNASDDCHAVFALLYGEDAGSRSRDASAGQASQKTVQDEGGQEDMPDQEQEGEEQRVDLDLIRQVLFSSDEPLHTADILAALNHFADRVFDRSQVGEMLAVLLEEEERPIKKFHTDDQFAVDRRRYRSWGDSEKKDLREVGKWCLSENPWEADELDEICELTLGLEGDPKESVLEIGDLAIRLRRRHAHVEERAAEFTKLKNGEVESFDQHSEAVATFCRTADVDLADLLPPSSQTEDLMPLDLPSSFPADKGNRPNLETFHDLYLSQRRHWLIPVYQRVYSWEPRHISAFIEGIEECLHNWSAGSAKKYFMGVIVTQVDEEDRPWLIDGQQRMTTCYLTIMAVAELLLEHSAVEAAAQLIRNYLLKDFGHAGTPSQGHDEPTLIPSIDDRRDLQTGLSQLIRLVFEKAEKCDVDPEGVPAEVNFGRWPVPAGTGTQSKIGYRLGQIKTKIRETEFSDPQSRGAKICIKEAGQESAVRFLGDFLTALLFGIELANFKVGSNQNAFSVFQKLNDTGMDLTLTDLVRSEIFMRERDVDQAVKFREDEFRTFEESMAIVPDILPSHADYQKRKIANRESNLDSLYSGIAVIASKGQAKRADAFSEIQGHFQSKNCQSPKNCLDLIESWAPFYRVVQGSQLTTSKVTIHGLPNEVLTQAKLMSLNSIPSPIRPMMAVLMSKTASGKVAEGDCLKCLRFLDSFLVRNACLSRGNAGLQGAFHPLVESWDYGKKDFVIGDVAGLQERLRHNQNLSIENLGDSAVRDSKTFKAMSKSIAKYILYRLDRGMRQTDPSQPHYFQECEVEHVYPQKPVKAWAESISNDDHGRLLNDFGNLTLLTPPANKAVLNEVYGKKKDYYKESEQRFVITSEIPDRHGNWDDSAIEERRNDLIERVLEFWQPPLSF